MFEETPEEPVIEDEEFMAEYSRVGATNPEHVRLYLRYRKLRESQQRSYLAWSAFMNFINEREERIFTIDYFETQQRSLKGFEDSSDSEYELEFDE